MHIDHQQPSEIKGILAWIERTGNRLPDPVFIFFYCIAVVVLMVIFPDVALYLPNLVK